MVMTVSFSSILTLEIDIKPNGSGFDRASESPDCIDFGLNDTIDESLFKQILN